MPEQPLGWFHIGIGDWLHKMTLMNFCAIFSYNYYDITIAFLIQAISTPRCRHQRRQLPSQRPNKSTQTQLLSLLSQEGCLPFWCPLDWVYRIGPALASVSALTGFQATSTQESPRDTTMVPMKCYIEIIIVVHVCHVGQFPSPCVLTFGYDCQNSCILKPLSRTVFRLSRSYDCQHTLVIILYIFSLSLPLPPLSPSVPSPTSGCVCIWDLGSSLLNGGGGAAAALGARQQLHPLIQIMNQSEPCRALAWCPHDSNYLVTGTICGCGLESTFISIFCVCSFSTSGGYSKSLTLWDIRQPFSPVDKQDKGIEN